MARREWISNAELRALWRAGVSYDGIAARNELATGWRPSRSGVCRKLERLGMRRRMTHDLPRIRPEHGNDIHRHMLQAASRRAQGRPVSKTDAALLAMYDRLADAGQRIEYDATRGFYLMSSET